MVNQFLNLVLFGPPGAGKGTQAKNIALEYNLIHLSTGDILRGEVEAKTELGIKAKNIMDTGLLVPDEVVINMIANKLNHHKDAAGFIFDGFPRTVEQAKALDKLLLSLNTSISLMIMLEVAQTELIQRLLKRAITEGRSDDADESIIRNRINEYELKTSPIADFYMTQKKMFRVNGTGTKESIFNDLCKLIDQKKG